jgi:WD40 repeat protein
MCLAHPQATSEDALAAGEQQPYWTAALHPKDPKLALVVAGSSVQLWDVAAMTVAAAAPAGQGLPVRDVTWAPNNEHRFASGGDDGKLRFWDTR